LCVLGPSMTMIDKTLLEVHVTLELYYTFKAGTHDQICIIRLVCNVISLIQVLADLSVLFNQNYQFGGYTSASVP